MMDSLNLFLSSSFRFASIFSKFFLVVFLAKDTSVLAKYTNLIFIFSYSYLFLGFEYCQYATREVIRKPSLFSESIKTQLAIFVLTLIAFLVVSVFFVGEYEYFILCVGLLILEYFTLEFSRYLVAFRENFKASLVVFFKSGLWVFSYLVYVYLFDNELNYFDLLTFWFLGCVVSFVFGSLCLFKGRLPAVQIYPDFTAVLWGFRRSCVFAFNALVFRFPFVFDKIFVVWMYGEKNSAVYNLFFVFSSFLLTFMEVVFFQHVFQDLIKEVSISDKSGLESLKKMVLKCSLFSSILSFSIFILWFFVGGWFYGEQYSGYNYVLILLLLSHIFLSVSYCYHYYIYALGCDKVNLLLNCFSVLFFAVVLFFSSSLYEVSTSFLLFSFVVFILKFTYVRVKRKSNAF